MKRLMIISVFFISLMLQPLYMQTMELENSSIVTGQLDNDHSEKIVDADVDEASLDVENLHEINLDTIDIFGSGNWLEKRIWYEKSQSAFDEVLQLVSKVVDMRVQFSNEVNAIGKKIDDFYVVVDFDTDQLDDKFKEILVSLDLKQKLEGDLSEKERSLQTAIKQELTVIDQLGKDIRAIGAIDAKIEQTLMQAFKTIDECRDYELKAWDNFKAVGKEIDDKLGGDPNEREVAEMKKKEDALQAIAVEKALEEERAKYDLEKESLKLEQNKSTSLWSYILNSFDWVKQSISSVVGVFDFSCFGCYVVSYANMIGSYLYQGLFLIKDAVLSSVQKIIGYFYKKSNVKKEPVVDEIVVPVTVVDESTVLPEQELTEVNNVVDDNLLQEENSEDQVEQLAVENNEISGEAVVE